MFDPFAQFNLVVRTNESVAPPSATMVLPNGPEVARAVPGHPETITYWLMDPTQHYQQITHDQAFAHDLYLQWAYGVAATAFDSMPPHMTDQELLGAVRALPSDAAALSAYTDAQILAYAHWAAPEVVIVGQPA
jgi:hypothetical protein